MTQGMKNLDRISIILIAIGLFASDIGAWSGVPFGIGIALLIVSMYVHRNES